ncbi:GlsB/YeaQ/YmgE family stress response membrane protein [Geothrix paludis]|uniref:GlsB/YeaQ/YmgE family stress response membrane protein n=1 Tax=Geothrix paludis TaxID=2922722 RepID=UPI001FAB966B|nr:GlsB/YeaQ/YmgE family stress response membrane protein [Geothrix paludis]
MLHLIWTCIIGLIAGAVAKLVMPGKDPGGWIITMVLGIAGSFLGTWIGRALGFYKEGHSAGFIMSVVGAVILLGIYHLYKRFTA